MRVKSWLGSVFDLGLFLSPLPSQIPFILTLHFITLFFDFCFMPTLPSFEFY